ncbi:PREDICTED: vascular endothelial growth factor A-like [Cyprinodon variegatus]|uniref:vascular endothelial growth factor A-like n=1 Tax=Cyprinodon variegatus TaxID=28743 RepID=UPI00074275DF|nr:PREDICTED: vascular endothelial growth factor A-like [Cyprinodon variegatus]
MQSISDTMCLPLVFLLLVPVQMTNIMDNERPRVVRKLEVLTKAECKPVEKLVNLKEKLSDYVNHIYVPSCVPLFHCSGCAADEALECYPTAERNVTIEVERSRQLINITFVEHQACGFRKIEKYKNNTTQGGTSAPGTDVQRIKLRRKRRKCKKSN